MLRKLAAIMASALLLASSAFALDYDFSGTFRQDNDIVRMNFTVGQTSNVTVFSSSWVKGGFDPILAIWSSSGSLIYQQDDGHNIGSTASNGTLYQHGYWDSYYDVLLTAGNYIATIGQYNNFANTSQLSGGFMHDNNPNFTYDQNYGGATQPLFNGVWSNNDPRTGIWEFHLLNVAQANVQDPNNPVPEPSTMALLGLGLAGVAFMRRRKSKQA